MIILAGILHIHNIYIYILYIHIYIYTHISITLYIYIYIYVFVGRERHRAEELARGQPPVAVRVRQAPDLLQVLRCFL